MKISFSWLKEYINTDLSAEQVASLLTGCGLEVESVTAYQSVKGGLAGLVIGQVLTCNRHPNADKLSLTTVDVGAGVPLQIVCGAPNVAAGQKVVIAVVGTTVHPVSGDSFEIKKSKIRGELSEGMICAEDEIGLGESHAGIMVLDDAAVVGTPANTYFGVEDDVVFEIGLTPNRVDAASHLGVARDLSALLGVKGNTSEVHSVNIPSTESFRKESDGRHITVEIADSAGCPRYTSVTIDGVKVGPSPDWLQHRLRSIGIGPINNVVDITNFVLHECGHPLHAFDADKILGDKVVVRRAESGERFVTLDGVERQLSSDDLMICNERKSMCIAGVFGGIESGISETTTTVFIESAYFDPGSIRKTGKRHALKTDASFRYERGADPEMTVYALKRAASLICEIAGGKVTSDISDFYPSPVSPAEVRLDYNRLASFIGDRIPSERILKILSSLGMKLISSDTEGCTIQIPTSKVDVVREVDVIEEILRIHGYDEIPIPSKLHMSLPFTDNTSEKLREKVAGHLTANGFNELLTNSLTIEGGPLSDGSGSVKLLNPLSQELGFMRTDMLQTMLQAVQHNRNRKQENLRFYEIGKCYFKTSDGYLETDRLAILISGAMFDANWKYSSRSVDFFQLKAFVQSVLSISGIDQYEVRSLDGSHAYLSSGQIYTVGKQPLITMGSVKRSIARSHDINGSFYYADIDWNRLTKLASKRKIQVDDIPRFPHVRRDLSMLIDRSLEFGRIESLAYSTERKILKDVVLFDVYEGDKLEQGKKSYAVSFVLQDDQQTLTDQVIDKTMDRLMKAFEKELQAVIRSGN